MKTLLFLLLFPLLSFAQNFPEKWWVEVPRSEAQSWEILPQDAGPGEVILSKRTELGIFSNFGATPFELDGKHFASIEGLWQSMKYPDPSWPKDPRHAITDWPYTRAEVEAMVGFEAKAAGDSANEVYKKHGFKGVNWGSQLFDHKDHGEGSDFHYQLIKRATAAKLDQNPELWDLLLRTGCLKLRPDHHQSPNDPPAYRYYDIYMEFRNERFLIPCEF